MAKLQNQGIEGLIKSAYYSGRLFSNSDQIERVDPPLPHSHTVRRAFRRLKLDAALYVDRVPTAYFKRVKRLDAKNIREWQTYLWNQHVVPLLVVISDTQINVYSGQALPTDKDDDVDGSGRLVQVFGKVADVLELDQVIASIETGEIFRKPDSFNRKHAVDRCLLENLTKTATDLTDCPNKPFMAEFAHLFLTRLLFTCYLIERKMIKGEHFADDPVLSHIGEKYKRLIDMLNDLSLSQAREALFRLFGHLKVHFNGSLLDVDLNDEKKEITDDHMQIIHSFLNGDDLKTGQYTLSFWAYDFSIIPIETISAIYQGFISEQGQLQQTSGSYYTPPHLAELAVDMLLENQKKPLYESKVLDPACGSGVFLVSMFNRMANQWIYKRGQHHKKTRAKELLNILEKRLFGIDLNETACHITCFSLYVAVLDHLEPWDIENLREQGLKLPKLLLASGEQQPENKQKTIIQGNFFDPKLQLNSTDFDFVIGNPPWVSRGKCKDRFFLNWREQDKDVRGPQKQIAHGFMWKTLERLNSSGKACLLLPTAVLLNKTDKFQAKWFRQVTVEEVINFSDLRFVLFSDAIHPGIAVRFNQRKPDIVKNVIRYKSPKVDIGSQRGGAVHIYDEDIKTIRLVELLSKADNKEAPRFWKTQSWGTWRDLKLLQRLSRMPRLKEKLKDKEGWITGVGIQPYGGDLNPIWWKNKRLFLDANNESIQLIVTQDECSPVDGLFPDRIHRPRTPEIFEPPVIVFNKGGSKIAFVGFPVLFRDSLFSISGTEDDKKILQFLVIALRSKLTKYYFFHTVANYGIERTQFFTEEIKNCPFLMPEQTCNPSRARKILSEVSSRFREFEDELRDQKHSIGRAEKVKQIQSECEPLIREYYDIDEYEQILIEDTVDYIIPSILPRANPRKEVKTLRRVNDEQQETYTKTLCRMLNIHARRGRKIEGYVVKTDSQAVVVISRTKGKPKPYNETSASQEMRQVLNRIHRLLPTKRGGFVYYRNLKIFDRDHIYIVKPMTFRSWMRSTALNDADMIASAVLQSGVKE